MLQMVDLHIKVLSENKSLETFSKEFSAKFPYIGELL